MKTKTLNGIVKATGIITILTIIGKILGFGREAVIASFFGASYQTDAYFIASIVPTLLFAAFGTAISLGIVPLYVEEKKKNEQKAKQIISTLGTYFILISLFLTGLSMVFAEEITRILAPGFNNEEIELTTRLTKIMIPSFVFLILASIATGVLHANKKFTLASLKVVPHNLIIILTVIFFTDRFGIEGLAYGTLIGFLSQYIIQYPQTKKYIKVVNFSLLKYKEELLKSLKIMFPIIVGSVVIQLNSVVDRMIASGLEEGSVSALNYSSRLMWLPLSIIIMSLITVLYPTIVDYAKDKAKNFFNVSLKGLNTIIYSSIPFTIVMMICSEEIVSIVFERGSFDEKATFMTSYSFYFYTIGMVFIGTREYLTRCLLALEDTKIQMYSSVIAVGFNIVLSIYLSKLFEHGGIAFATSIAMFIQTIFLLYYLLKRTKANTKEIKNMMFNFFKLIFLSVVIYGIVVVMNNMFQIEHDFVKLVLNTIIVFALFIIVSYLIKIEEMKFILSKLKRG